MGGMGMPPGMMGGGPGMGPGPMGPAGMPFWDSSLAKKQQQLSLPYLSQVCFVLYLVDL